MWCSQKFLAYLLVGLIVFTSTNVLAGNDNNLSVDAKTVTTSFITPSGNIYCALVGEDKNTLRCEIRTKLNPIPPQPYRGYCEFDWGAGFLLPKYGKAEVLCISDTIDGSNYLLSYGSTWTNAGFKCLSQKIGLTCTNSTGQGFFLSRERWNVLRKG